MTVLIFIGAVFWGLLAAQLLVQAAVSTLNGLIPLLGLFLSKVDRSTNAMGAVAGLVQGAVFWALLAGGYWLSLRFFNYSAWDGVEVAMVIAFVVSFAYCAIQIPGKLYLAWVCAWEPHFFQSATLVPPQQRLAYAMKWRSDKRTEAN